jgi:tetratricopeptide (TPR) repeat protein
MRLIKPFSEIRRRCAVAALMFCFGVAGLALPAMAETEPRPTAEIGHTPEPDQAPPAGDAPASETDLHAADDGAADHAAVADDASAERIEDMLDDSGDPLKQIEQQIQTKEYDAAVRWLEDHVEEVESTSHRFENGLVRPLTLLGDAYVGKGEFVTALEHYQRAIHLSRVNDGLNSPTQVEIVYREAHALKALGEFRQANDREEYAYHVLTRAHDPTDEKLLPGIYHLAQWYERTSNVFAARALYQHAVTIISANEKLDTPEAIPAFQGLASSYRMERFPSFLRTDMEPAGASGVMANTGGTGGVQQQLSVNNFPAGEAALQRIVRIRQAQQPFDQLALAEAVLELADWYTLFDKPQRSVPLYAHAWELLEGIEGYDVASRFAQPELLYFPTPENPSAPAAVDRGAADTGYVEVAFDVTDTGHVRSLNTVGSLPDGLMDFRVRKSLRVARYRPMLVDGVPVAKQAHVYRHEFPYFQAREDDESGGDEPAAATARG